MWWCSNQLDAYHLAQNEEEKHYSSIVDVYHLWICECTWECGFTSVICMIVGEHQRRKRDDLQLLEGAPSFVDPLVVIVSTG
uniref:Uncharacterized protein n=1 Tax=Setaria italica TaxID=4555 RepID=K4AHE4_SETIT